MSIRGKFSVVLIFLLVCISISIPGAPSKAWADGTLELLPNSGFETVANGAPTQWNQYNASYPVNVSTTRTYAGNYSAKLDDPSPAAQPGLRSTKVSVTAGQDYRASVYAYIESGEPLVYLEFWDNAGVRIQVKTVKGTPAAEWQQLVVEDTAPAGAVKASILLYGTSASQGVAYFDDASIVALSPQLLSNPGFETVSNNLPSLWTQFSATYTVYASTYRKVEETYSAKLDDPSPSAQPGLRSAKATITAGDAYEAAVYAYVESGNPLVYLEFWNSAGSRLQVKTVTLSPEAKWKRIVLRDVAPAGATKVSVLLYGTSASQGIAYFDQATVREIPLDDMLEIPNGSFELLTNGFPTGWHPFNSFLPFQSATDVVYKGSKSVKLVDTSETINTGLRSEKVPIQPDQSYTASIRYYGVKGTPDLWLEFWNAAGARIEFRFEHGVKKNGWGTLEVQGTAPADAKYASILIYSTSPNAGTTYFDDAKITPLAPEPVRTFPQLVTGHPRVYFTANDIAGLRTKAADTSSNPFDASGKEIWDGIKSAADDYLTETEMTLTYYGGYQVTYDLDPLVQPPHQPDPPGYTGGAYPYWTGMSGQINNRIQTLSLAYVISNDIDYANKAKAYVMDLLQWNDWSDPYVVCAGACQEVFYFSSAVTTAYDMLYDLFTPAERTQIRDVLRAKGLEPIYLGSVPNGGQVAIATALASGGAALLGEVPEANKYLTRATSIIQGYNDARMTSGENEGFGYTHFSTESLVKAIDQIERVTGLNEWSEHPFMDDFIVRWAMYSLAPGGAGLAAFSDSLAENRFHNTMSYINSKLGNGYAGWYLQETRPDATLMDRFLFLHPQAPVGDPNDLPTSAVLPEVGMADLRSGWSISDTLLSMKSDNSGYNHNHFDQNSFQIATNGTWIGRDPAYKGSDDLYQFPIRSGHSTIRVDGQGQDNKGGGELTGGMLSPTYDYVKGSAAGAYIDRKLNKFDRHIVYVKPDYFVIYDDLQADAPRQFDWAMFNGPLYDYKVDGQTVTPGQTVNGNDLFVQNGSAQLSAKFVSTSALPIKVATESPAEMYGYMTTVNSSVYTTDYRYITVLKAAPFDAAGYYQETDIAPLLSAAGATSGKGYAADNKVGAGVLSYGATTPGDYIQFPVTVSQSGTYRLDTTFMASPTYGKVQTYIDGQPVGGVYDGQFFAYLPAKTFAHGTVSLSAGTHTIRYEALAGANEPTENHGFGIESLRLKLANAVETIDPAMEIDADPLQATGVTGTKVKRTATLDDYIVFKTGSSTYTVSGIGSDADNAVVTKSVYSAHPVGYSMTRGTVLSNSGTTLLQAASPFNAALNYDDVDPGKLQGFIETTGTLSVSIYVPAVAQVKIDGTTLTGGQYAYNTTTQLLSVSIAAGMHEIIVTD